MYIVTPYPILDRFLPYRFFQQIADMAFVNLPSLQMVELQENEINFIAPTAFMDTPHLLMLNLSHNEIPSLDVSGLTGAKSLEMLDASHNLIASVASASLEKMEWLVSFHNNCKYNCD